MASEKRPLKRLRSFEPTAQGDICHTDLTPNMEGLLMGAFALRQDEESLTRENTASKQDGDGLARENTADTAHKLTKRMRSVEDIRDTPGPALTTSVKLIKTPCVCFVDQDNLNSSGESIEETMVTGGSSSSAGDCCASDEDQDEVDGRFLRVRRRCELHDNQLAGEVGIAMIKQTERKPQKIFRKVTSKFFCLSKQLSYDALDSDGKISPVFMQDPGAETLATKKVPLGMVVQTKMDATYRRHFVQDLHPDSIAANFKFKIGDEILMIDDTLTVNMWHATVVDTFDQLKVGKDITFIFRRDMRKGVREPEYEYIKVKVIVEAIETKGEDRDLIVPDTVPEILRASSSDLFFRRKDVFAVRGQSSNHYYFKYEGGSIVMRNGLDLADDSFHIHCLQFIDFESLSKPSSNPYFVFCHVTNSNVNVLAYDGSRGVQVKEMKINVENPKSVSEISNIVFRAKNIIEQPDSSGRNTLTCNLETNKTGYYLRSPKQKLDVIPLGNKRLEEMAELRFIMEKIPLGKNNGNDIL